MTNPYIEAAVAHCEEIRFRAADPDVDHTQAATAFGLLAIAWELKKAREEREVEAELEEHRANVRARMER